MMLFSIHELQNLSGIKAHTIRAWEQRYGILKPERSKGNCRHYCLEELKLLLDIVLVVKSGKRISYVSEMSREKLDSQLKEISDNVLAKEKVIAALVCSMFYKEVDEFESILDSSINSWGTDISIRDVIIPFLQRVNLLSFNNSSLEVHFVVTIIRKKIILGIENTTPTNVLDKSALLFLPENEHYDLILLY
ncbi:MAG TPA: MerR family transcriptional regulator, partial [Flavisolibacter sp.]|nr:MerR family transcriptional regulator [Flavisolibacter sp.]